MSAAARPRILVVEDEPSIADTIVYTMEQEGFAPVVCGTGAAALDCAKQEAFALVLLDIGLPDTSGLEVCRQLRTLRDMPVIFLTARQSEMDRVVGLEIGGDDYVCKPFSPRELTARVRAVLRRSGSGANPPNHDGTRQPLIVDEERCQIRYFGEALPLSRYEYRLLQALVHHPGRVFSRAQLMEQASDEPEASMERTVDAHVKSIRAKMKQVRDDLEPIVTHRGMGYSLAETLP
jgi:two-component system catabolic regulation response regulator CreB